MHTSSVMKILYHRDRSKNQIFTCFAMRLSRCPAGLGALGAGCRPCEMDFWFALQPTRCGSSGLPRKEVIQPHLPVRLPCYDFTPLTLHTFDASAPEGFGRRLRVQTTRVV